MANNASAEDILKEIMGHAVMDETFRHDLLDHSKPAATVLSDAGWATPPLPGAPYADVVAAIEDVRTHVGDSGGKDILLGAVAAARVGIA